MLLLSSLLAGQVETPAGEELKAEVRRLVRQLDAPQLAQREAAEAELLRRGPAMLDLLPPPTDRTSAEVRQRLGRVRQKLQQQAADAAARPSTSRFTPTPCRSPRSWRRSQRQSGNTIVDYRRQFGQPVTDPTLKVHFDKTPFWPALDQVLDQAGLTVYPFAEQPAIDVVAASGEKRIGPRRPRLLQRAVPLRAGRRRGPARSAPGRRRSLVVTRRSAWEPRLRIIGLTQRMADVTAVDERGNPLPVADREAQLEIPTSGEAPAVKLDLPLRLPSRDVRRIASLKGKLRP